MTQDLTPVERPDRAIIQDCNWDPNVSSIGDASGSTSSTVSGVDEPWSRTSQTIRIDYVRVATQTQPAALDVMGLSQVSAVDNIKSTQLYAVATLYNKQEKVYLPVGTSGFTQYQKVALNAESTDQYANSYGVVSGFIMGPQGSITTVQPYFKQEKWQSWMEEHDFKQTGTSHALQDTSAMKWYNGTNLDDPLSIYVQSRKFWRNLESVYKPGGGNEGYFKGGYSLPTGEYYMAGAYNTSAEDAWMNEAAGKSKLTAIFFNILACFQSSSFNSRWAIPQPTVSDGDWWIREGDRVIQNTYHDRWYYDFG